jgi:hypothetical protein
MPHAHILLFLLQLEVEDDGRSLLLGSGECL